MTDDTLTAYHAQVTVYGAVGALAVLLWDVLDNWYKDYRLLFGSERKSSIISATAYVVSRIAALGYLISAVIFYTAPIQHCQRMGKIVNAWCPPALASTAYLFLLRLCAVYSHSKVVQIAFLLCWFGLISAVAFVPFFSTGGVQVASPMYCEFSHISALASIAQIAPLVYDTLVFVAISGRIYRNTLMNSKNEMNIGNMISGRNLPAFTKMILQDGQLYYLITLIAGISAVILRFNPSVPRPLKTLANDPYHTLVNIMACRVYRNTLSAVFCPNPSNVATRSSQTKRSLLPLNISSTSTREFKTTSGIFDCTGLVTESISSVS